MTSTHTVKVPGGEVELRYGSSLFAFIFLMGAVGCLLGFVLAGLSGHNDHWGSSESGKRNLIFLWQKLIIYKLISIVCHIVKQK
jgi:hypothetical protein